MQNGLPRGAASTAKTVLALAGFSLGTLMACAPTESPVAQVPVVAKPATAATPASTPTPAAAQASKPAGIPLSTPRVEDGKFVTKAYYAGRCVGGRGGCYGLTFFPNGVVRVGMLDASLDSRYTVTGDTVRWGVPKGKEADPAAGEHVTTKDGFRTLGEYRYVPRLTRTTAWSDSANAVLVCRPDGTGTWRDTQGRQDGYCSTPPLEGGPQQVRFHHDKATRAWTLAADGSSLAGATGLELMAAAPAELAQAPQHLSGPNYSVTPAGIVKLGSPNIYAQQGCDHVPPGCARLTLTAEGKAAWWGPEASAVVRGSYSVTAEPGDPPRIKGIRFEPGEGAALDFSSSDDLIHLKTGGVTLVRKQP